MFNRDQEDRNRQEKANDLKELVTIVPAGTKDTDRFFGVLSKWELERLLETCKIEGACILLVDDFLILDAGQEAMLFQTTKDGIGLFNIRLIAPKAETSRVGSRMIHLKDITAGKWPELRAKILAGEYSLVPSGIMSLEVGDERFTPRQR
jgi:hypothetical protein